MMISKLTIRQLYHIPPSRVTALYLLNRGESGSLLKTAKHQTRHSRPKSFRSGKPNLILTCHQRSSRISSTLLPHGLFSTIISSTIKVDLPVHLHTTFPLAADHKPNQSNNLELPPRFQIRPSTSPICSFSPSSEALQLYPPVLTVRKPNLVLPHLLFRESPHLISAKPSRQSLSRSLSG